MEKNTGQKNQNEEETLADQEVWLTIRYLDPDPKPEASDAVVVAVVSVLSVLCACAVCMVLKLRGL